MHSERLLQAGYVHLSGVGKAYAENAHPWQVLRAVLTRKPPHRQRWVLQDVNLTLSPGSSLGVIGSNGAGKSTLLQIIAGTLQPSVGVRTCTGRIGALLELGAGFNPEFTGRENAQMACVVMGLTPQEATDALSHIQAFADIGSAWGRPVKTYSSGMYVRLAFAVATAIEPDILIVDEALAVGDAAFARKSYDRIMALRERGATLVFCTHALYQVEMLCEQAIWLDQGRVMAHGTAAEVVARYNEHLKIQERQAQPTAVDGGARVLGSADRPARVSDLGLLVNGSPCPRHAIAEVRSGLDELGIRIRVEHDSALPTPTIGVLISDAAGMHVSSCASYHDHVDLVSQSGAFCIDLYFPKFPLMRGIYTVDIFLLCERAVHVYEHIVQAARFEVLSSGPELGIVRLPHRWEVC